MSGLLSRRTLAVAAILAGLVYPFVVPNDYFVYVMALAYIYAIAALGLNLMLGYTGHLNLAHAAFMAIGAYTVGILTVDYGVPYWIAFLLAGVNAAALGFVAGIISLRLKHHYFSIFTLCIGIIVWLVIEKWDGLTHGVVGIMGIPAPTGIGPIRFDTTLAQYYLILAMLALALVVMDRIVHSLTGRAFMAIRNGEPLAEALGVPLMRTKVLSFVISVAYAGFAGALYAGFVRFLGPSIAAETNAFDMIAFILVGGLGTLSGPVIGAIMLTWATQSLQFLQDYRLLVFGPLLILLVMFMPKGIIGTLKARQAREAGERASAARREQAEADASADGRKAPAHA
ncbi:branched-chain amino acid ABC transporter permease [Enterovirga rhinocerotis]|uniref:Amino acid/amide ABC transporter membrane protein 2 (HAAT family) n=1 Tax=Enterovirga rhinocerotis TaxID=1339210 RepID=A0A4R7C8S2_9HYPH|nr:branched-chain amino acid ABC transporter permease [Enterovirga rhinocerotis]TDR95050.1 amino acid/amide ABC transporter membrane protein 2 (HAAT family) [Enterovirga rhinocerotis]